jgi:CRP-like cAMP-binding protein
LDNLIFINVAEYYYSQRQSGLAAFVYSKYIKYCPEEENAKTAKERIEEMKKTSPVNIPDEFDSSKINRVYPKDTMLFVEGEPGEELFIIQSGSIKITKIMDKTEVLLAMLKTGDIVGEMALLEGKPRAASAIAYEDCTVMAVNKKNFELMSKSQPQLIAKVTTLLAERIWFIYKQLNNTLLDNPLCRMYDALYIQMEKNKVPLEGKVPYSFSFGKTELISMVGLPEPEGMLLLDEMLESKTIQIVDGKIHATSVEELVKLTQYHRKMDKIEKNKKRENDTSN